MAPFVVAYAEAQDDSERKRHDQDYSGRLGQSPASQQSYGRRQQEREQNRPNGTKTALAKYSAAITPNTAITVMDRAIATSLRMRAPPKPNFSGN
jgi:hypothetical protein